MLEILVTFDRALAPLFTISRIAGAYPFDSKNRFSICLYLYSLCLGLAICLVRLVVVATWKFIRDTFLWGCVYLSQAILLLSWLVYSFYAPRCGHHREALAGLRKASMNRVRFPWLSYSVIVVEVLKTVLLIFLRRRITLRVLVDIVFHFVSKAPVLLVPMQFSSLAEITSFIVSEQEKRLDSLFLDTNGYFLQLNYNIYRLFDSINEYYGPTLQVSVAYVFAVCPPFTFMAMKHAIISEGGSNFFVISEVIIHFYAAFVFARTSHTVRKQVVQFKEKVKQQARQYENFLLNVRKISEIQIVNNHLQDKIILFIEYNPKINPKCSAFKINYSLIINLCGTCLTYMIILYQFVHI